MEKLEPVEESLHVSLGRNGVDKNNGLDLPSPPYCTWRRRNIYGDPGRDFLIVVCRKVTGLCSRPGTEKEGASVLPVNVEAAEPGGRAVRVGELWEDAVVRRRHDG